MTQRATLGLLTFMLPLLVFSFSILFSKLLGAPNPFAW